MKAALGLLSAMALVATSVTCAAEEPVKVPRVGYIRSGSFNSDPYREHFVQGMRDLGWGAPRNVAFEFQNYGEDHHAAAAAVEELLRITVDVIVIGGTPAIRAAQAATRTVPIVMAAVNDPIGAGFIQSLARPGGNITGLALLSPELTTKRLELIKELMPTATRIAILQNPDNSGHQMIVKEVKPASRSIGLELRVFEARSPDDLEPAFEAMRQWQSHAAIVLDDAVFIASRAQLAAQAITHQLPLACGFREVVQAGCMLAYSASLADMWYRSAGYVDKILKGAKPANLPVQQGTKFELVINLKTAKAIGFTIAEPFLARADEVIE